MNAHLVVVGGLGLSPRILGLAGLLRSLPLGLRVRLHRIEPLHLGCRKHTHTHTGAVKVG